MSDTENTPLLTSGIVKRRYRHGSQGSLSSADSGDPREESSKSQEIKLKRHITLWHAVLIILGNVIGSGIFVSPKGVTANVKSVGASLIVWAVTGFVNIAQALCYAELGGMIPAAGGDYAYLYYILGPLPAFLCAWIHILVISASSCAVIARTAALYLVDPFQLGCSDSFITLVAAFIIVSLALINAVSAVWGTRVHIIFTVSKIIALLVVIIAGIVFLAQGKTHNFENGFEGSATDPGAIVLGFLDGYFAYKAWELINALPEEMTNPKRDLQPAVVISMLLVTGIYVLTNAAYFTVLTPAELVSSDAVALTFSEKALGWFALVMPVAVSLSCMGAVNGDFLANSRYLFAGGRFRQVPVVFSYIHVKWLTPILAVIALGALALIYCLITDLQKLQEYASLTVQLKTVLVLVALFYYRWKKPDIDRPFRVNTVLAVITFLVTVAVVILSFYKSPVTTGIGVGVLFVGVPVYFLGRLCLRSQSANGCMDIVSRALQKILLVVPESGRGKFDPDASFKK